VVIEYKLARCESCTQALALRYVWLAAGLPAPQDTFVSVSVQCPNPRCRHANPMIVPMQATGLAVWGIPGCDAGPRSFQPNALRRAAGGTDSKEAFSPSG
jgi:hypothetical protein